MSILDQNNFTKKLPASGGKEARISSGTARPIFQKNGIPCSDQFDRITNPAGPLKGNGGGIADGFWGGRPDRQILTVVDALEGAGGRVMIQRAGRRRHCNRSLFDARRFRVPAF
jgi:hypothetical protein